MWRLWRVAAVTALRQHLRGSGHEDLVRTSDMASHSPLTAPLLLQDLGSLTFWKDSLITHSMDSLFFFFFFNAYAMDYIVCKSIIEHFFLGTQIQEI